MKTINGHGQSIKSDFYHIFSFKETIKAYGKVYIEYKWSTKRSRRRS